MSKKCGCKVEMVPVKRSYFNEPKIQYCPLHAHAEELRQLVLKLTKHIREACPEGSIVKRWIEDAETLAKSTPRG